MNLLNNILDNDVVFYLIFMGVVGAIAYLFIILIFNIYSDKVDKVEKGTQTLS
jgi:hypothetical protein